MQSSWTHSFQVPHNPASTFGATLAILPQHLIITLTRREIPEMMPTAAELPFVSSETANILITCSFSLRPVQHIRLRGPDREGRGEPCPCCSPRGRMQKHGEVGSGEGRCDDSRLADPIGFSPQGAHECVCAVRPWGGGCVQPSPLWWK